MNFTPDGRKHQVYRITHKIKHMYYYGSKTNNGILGESYISSSRDANFIKEQKEHPERFKYKIIKTYDNTSDKIIHEAYLHHRFNVKIHNRFYNNANQTPFGFNTTGKVGANKGRKWSREIKEKQSASKKGDKNPMYGKKRDKLFGENNYNFGNKMSEESKNKMRETIKNKPTLMCPHCKKEGKSSVFKRWHFDNCKFISLISDQQHVKQRNCQV